MRVNLVIYITELSSQSYTPKPRFVGSVKNRTAALGREASLECSVENLGNYKVIRSNGSRYTHPLLQALLNG